eukprot:2053003-Amphidinium_carterae.2
MVLAANAFVQQGINQHIWLLAVCVFGVRVLDAVQLVRPQRWFVLVTLPTVWEMAQDLAIVVLVPNDVTCSLEAGILAEDAKEGYCPNECAKLWDWPPGWTGGHNQEHRFNVIQTWMLCAILLQRWDALTQVTWRCMGCLFTASPTYDEVAGERPNLPPAWRASGPRLAGPAEQPPAQLAEPPLGWTNGISAKQTTYARGVELVGTAGTSCNANAQAHFCPLPP